MLTKSHHATAAMAELWAISVVSTAQDSNKWYFVLIYWWINLYSYYIATLEVHVEQIGGPKNPSLPVW